MILKQIFLRCFLGFVTLILYSQAVWSKNWAEEEHSWKQGKAWKQGSACKPGFIGLGRHAAIAGFLDLKKVALYAQVKIPGKTGKRVVQSFAVNPYDDEIYTVSTISKKRKKHQKNFREKSILWALERDGKKAIPIFNTVTKRLGHPQDLSLELGEGRARLWSSNSSGRGASRFSFQGKNNLSQLEDYILFPKNYHHSMPAISLEGQYLVVAAKPRKRKKKHLEKRLLNRFLQGGFDAAVDELGNSLLSSKKGAGYQVRVYDASRLIAIGPGDHSHIKPLYKWPLSKKQSGKAQWRQGIAVTSRYVYVLTGSSKAHKVKYLSRYTLRGRLVSEVAFTTGSDYAKKPKKYRFCEPEGMEIISIKGRSFALIGIASGKIGHRNYHIWKIPIF